MLSLSLVASSGLLQAPVMPSMQAAVSMPADVQMFVGGKQANPGVDNFGAKGAAGLVKTGKAPTALKGTKKGISSKRTAQTYVDVTGAAYQEANVFIPKYDEIGVLPPLGRWDPLQIREQVRGNGTESWPAPGTAAAVERLVQAAVAIGGQCVCVIAPAGGEQWGRAACAPVRLPPREGGHAWRPRGGPRAASRGSACLRCRPLAFGLHASPVAVTLLIASCDVHLLARRARSATAALLRWRSSTAACQWLRSSA